MRAVAELLERKKSRLRGCVLLLLSCMAVCLCLRTQPEALPDVQTTERGEAALAGMTVALDPGHGGYDGGARARDSGRWEKDINLEIALAVEKELAAQGAQGDPDSAGGRLPLRGRNHRHQGPQAGRPSAAGEYRVGKSGGCVFEHSHERIPQPQRKWPAGLLSAGRGCRAAAGRRICRSI